MVHICAKKDLYIYIYFFLWYLWYLWCHHSESSLVQHYIRWYHMQNACGTCGSTISNRLAPFFDHGQVEAHILNGLLELRSVNVQDPFAAPVW